ncbi:unnamed protein product [Symbiodinium natans]|uniref:FHA domain-containing protein n=1 Tax=Symbiodinium natans TaxID=878477 RepID=A0A812IFN8_9DINO|nr:unnamed protein product [Symbiodinium natans]
MELQSAIKCFFLQYWKLRYFDERDNDDDDDGDAIMPWQHFLVTADGVSLRPERFPSEGSRPVASALTTRPSTAFLHGTGGAADRAVARCRASTSHTPRGYAAEDFNHGQPKGPEGLKTRSLLDVVLARIALGVGRSTHLCILILCRDHDGSRNFSPQVGQDLDEANTPDAREPAAIPTAPLDLRTEDGISFLGVELLPVFALEVGGQSLRSDVPKKDLRIIHGPAITQGRKIGSCLPLLLGRSPQRSYWQRLLNPDALYALSRQHLQIEVGDEISLTSRSAAFYVRNLSASNPIRLCRTLVPEEFASAVPLSHGGRRPLQHSDIIVLNPVQGFSLWLVFRDLFTDQASRSEARASGDIPTDPALALRRTDVFEANAKEGARPATEINANASESKEGDVAEEV